MAGVHRISLCTVRLTSRREFDDGTETGSAVMTGFIWRKNDRTYLLTNWHNVTGRDQNTNVYLGAFAPSHLSCECRCVRTDRNSARTFSFDLPLFDDNGEPNWIEHPDGRSVDVVAIKFACELPENHELVALNEQDFEPAWEPQIGDEGFIVGYPEGFAGAHATPIWKRGSIASEPSFDFEGQPFLLMDTIGNKGLSGSPVIGRGKGVLRTREGEDGWTSSDVIGTWEKFIGIYAGRMCNEGIGSQLGRVWKASTIEEILP